MRSDHLDIIAHKIELQCGPYGITQHDCGLKCMSVFQKNFKYYQTRSN
jgi:hypothetical protein